MAQCDLLKHLRVEEWKLVQCITQLETQPARTPSRLVLLIFLKEASTKAKAQDQEILALPSPAN